MKTRKLNETARELSIRSANISNEIRIMSNRKDGVISATYTEWDKIITAYNLPYRIETLSNFIDDGVLFKVSEKRNANNRLYNLYSFKNTPLHFAYFEKIHSNRRQKARKNYNNKNDMKKEKPRTFSIANHGVSITSFNNEKELKDFTDSELVTELRDRGYIVTAEKVTVTKL